MTIAKTLQIVVAALALAGPAQAQAELELPRDCPTARVSQQVGLTEIVVEYGSPAATGRRVWGTLVPYDRPWSISQGRPTTIRFSRDVTVGGAPVAAGTYRLSAIPSKDAWTFLLARAGDRAAGAGTPAGAGPEPAPIRVRVRPKAAPHRERLTFLFSDFNSERTSLDLEWENLRASLPIAANTAAEVQASIKELDGAWRSYANAARFMLETKKDFDAGLKYANQSLALKEDWYTFWIKASLLAAKHDYKGAIEQGERAYQLGNELGDGFVLEPELKKALADWKKKV